MQSLKYINFQIQTKILICKESQLKMVQQKSSIIMMFIVFNLFVSIRSIQYLFEWQEKSSLDHPNQKFPEQPGVYLGQFSIGQTIRIQLKAPNNQNKTILDPLDTTTGPSAGYSDHDMFNRNGHAGTYNIPGKSGLYYQSYNSNQYTLFVPYSDLTGSCIDTSGQNNHFQTASCFFIYQIKVNSKYLLLLTTGESLYNNLAFYYVDAYTYLSGTAFTPSNNSRIVQILKMVEVLRNKVHKIIYFNETKSSTIRLFPVNSDPYGNPLLSRRIQIFPVIMPGLGNEFVLNYPIQSFKLSFNPAARTLNYTYTFQQGFYLLRLYTSDQYIYNVKFYFESDEYLCPFNSNYRDIYANFQGCIPTQASRYGYPCGVYDQITGRCKQCYSGFKLQNYTCLTIRNGLCPERTYFRFGNCLDVNPLCGEFDLYTGECLSCIDPLNYNLIKKACIQKIVLCLQRQYKVNGSCLNISQYCDTFDKNTGYCLSCKSNIYRLGSYGICSPLVLDCAPGLYQDGDTCLQIPGSCTNYDRKLRKCLQCILGYRSDTSGICYRLKCPDRYIPSSYGQFCQKVSDECGAYDSVYGDCITCSSIGYIPRDGSCVKIVSALYSCRSKHQLGYGIDCGSNNVNCQIYDLYKYQCHKCQLGFYLNHNFLCTKNAICAGNQYLFNNQCRDIPKNCLIVNPLGHCTSCINQNYRLILHQCIFTILCLGRQYLNIYDQCVDVSAQCDMFNPTNGQCITCLNGKNPRQGICCDFGLIYDRGMCLNEWLVEVNFDTNTTPICKLKHPFLEICLKCPQGYSVSYEIPYACV